MGGRDSPEQTMSVISQEYPHSRRRVIFKLPDYLLWGTARLKIAVVECC